MKNRHKKINKPLVRTLVGLVLLGLFVLVALRNLDSLRDGWAVLIAVPWWWFVFGVMLYALTQFFGATSYYYLALRRVSWREFYVVEWASAGINRLLPAGTGSIGIHGLYLLRRKHSVAETAVVIGVNHILSTGTHLLMLLAVFPAVHQVLTARNIALPGGVKSIALVVLATLVVLLFVPKVRNLLATFGAEFIRSLGKYKHKKAKIIKSALAVSGITLANSLLLASAAWAVGEKLGLTTAFIVFSVGVAFGVLFPTPGGLGGVETGLVAALMVFGLASAPAIAVAVLYRFVNFWMPLVVGNIVFLAVRRRGLFIPR